MLKIGELATRAGCPVETIRYYGRKGMPRTPARSNGNYRLCDSAHVERISFIRHCRSLDMSLDEMRALLRLRGLAPDRGPQGAGAGYGCFAANAAGSRQRGIAAY